MSKDDDFHDMLKECQRKHSNIDEGIRLLLSENACHHFDTFGSFVVGRSILITEVVDEYGHMHLLSFGSPNLRPWEVKGMLSYVEDSVIRDDT
jgi:hypothetical protein